MQRDLAICGSGDERFVAAIFLLPYFHSSRQSPISDAIL
jgi:hypothetical protein